MNLGLIRPESPQAQQPATPPPQTQNTGGSGWGWGWSTVTSMAGAVKSMVTGTSSNADDESLSLATAKITIPAKESYLDSVKQPKVAGPINYGDYRSDLARAGCNDSRDMPGTYLPKDIMNASMQAYREACNKNSEKFIAQMTSLETKLQYATSQHNAMEQEIADMQKAMTELEQKVKTEKAEANQLVYNRFMTGGRIRDMSESIQFKTRQIKEEKALLATVTKCLNESGTVEARATSAEHFCTEDMFRNAILNVIENQHLVVKNSWSRHPTQVFSKANLSAAELAYVERLESGEASVSEMMSSFVELISANKKYKNSIEDLQKLRSTLDRFCFMMEVTHQDQTKYAGGTRCFADFRAQLNDDIDVAKSLEKHRLKAGQASLEAVIAQYESEEQTKRLKPRAAALVEAISTFVQDTEASAETSLMLTESERDLRVALASEKPSANEVINLFFGKVLTLEKYAGAKAQSEAVLSAFTKFMEVYKAAHELSAKAKTESYLDRCAFSEIQKLHTASCQRFAEPEAIDQAED